MLGGFNIFILVYKSELLVWNVRCIHFLFNVYNTAKTHWCTETFYVFPNFVQIKITQILHNNTIEHSSNNQNTFINFSAYI